jgi:hypothetical protein
MKGNPMDEHDHYDMEDDDRPDEGSTCILACAFGLVTLAAMIATGIWLAKGGN